MSPAQGAKRAASYDVQAHIVIAKLRQTGNPPFSGSFDYAGDVGSTLGKGAILGHSEFASPGEFSGTFKVFYNKGTVTGDLAGTGTPNPDGSITITGDGHFTKGTGKYKGATGKFTFTGSQASYDAQTTTFDVKGKVKY